MAFFLQFPVTQCISVVRSKLDILQLCCDLVYELIAQIFAWSIHLQVTNSARKALSRAVDNRGKCYPREHLPGTLLLSSSN